MKASEEILALTIAILRLKPNYLKYRVGEYEVELKWAENRKSVEVFYKFHDIVIFGVNVSVAEHPDGVKLSAEMVPIFKSNGLSEKQSVETLYMLLPVIVRANFQNDKELDDTDEAVTRDW